jgi:hypothetical protein
VLDADPPEIRGRPAWDGGRVSDIVMTMVLAGFGRGRSTAEAG